MKITLLIKEKKEEITDEIEIHIELFYELFHQQSFDKAEIYMKLLKYKLNNFSKIMQKYLNNNFFLVYRRYFVFIEKAFIGKLENYFENTMDKHVKRIYRTPE